MAKAPKKLGCSNLKQMVESDKILFKDFQIINELTTFIEKKNSFEAEDGCHDDLVMCLVMYAWAVAQDYFREMTDQNVREELYEKDKSQLEEDMAPFGFIVDGLDEDQEVTEGEVWTKTTWDEDPYWDKYKPKVDEYGMANSDWQFAGGTQNNDWY